MITSLQVWDSRWFFWLNHSLQNPVLDWLMPRVSELGSGGFVWLFAAFGLALFGKGNGRKMAFLGMLALLIAWFFGNELLKSWFARPRPFLTLADVRLLVDKPGDFSFPSGHTTISFAPAVAFYRKDKAIGVAALFLAGIIGFSRIYVGVHYPLDVVGGAVVGTGAGLLVSGFESMIDRSALRLNILARYVKDKTR